MSDEAQPKLNRRRFLKRTALAAGAGAAAIGAGSYWLGGNSRVSRAMGTKVIVIGIDGMDPRLTEALMKRDHLPNLKKLWFSRLGTSVPPQSPVAWANFINGAGPGSHGIFDFIHRNPHKQCAMFYGAAETIPGEGYWEVDDHNLPLDFWPFNHRPAETVLRRQGVPFWDFLDEAGVPTTFYDLPCNYPPSPSKHGHHRCIAGMGVTDMLGTYGTYQCFAENFPEDELDKQDFDKPTDHGDGKRSRLKFEAETARATLVGPQNSLRIVPTPIMVEFLVHRDRDADGGKGAAVIDIQGKRLMLRAGQWSPWTKLDFRLSTPWFMPSQKASGICRFFVQEIAPNFRLYVTPINIDPGDPAGTISEPSSFIQAASGRLGPFATTGFQEAYQARKDKVFNDDEFKRQAEMVLEERLALFDYAVNNYDDGLLFFYFSSSDLQSHLLWWDAAENGTHPSRDAGEATANFAHVHGLYQRLDKVIGDIVDRYGSQATIIVMSDHGFANFGRQFNLNSWLRAQGYLGPPECTSIMHDVDWARTPVYGLGLNGLYLNMKGRERDGIVEPGEQREALLTELAARLEAVQDDDDHGNQSVIRGVYRADRIYTGTATALAPDLIIGYRRGYRASWATVQGDLTDDILFDNDSAWSADHCADALEVPGVLFSNRPIRAGAPSLVDVAPSILAEFGLSRPPSMVGRNIFSG